MTTTGAAVQPSDVQLVAASRFDGVHFLAVFDRHASGVHAYLARRMGDGAADSGLGEAFASAYASRRHFRAWGDSAGPWLLGVATGLVRRQWRLEQARLRSFRDEPADCGAGAIADHLQHLAARDRDILLLAAWEDQEPAAVAMALDLPDRAVVSRLAGLAGELAWFATAPSRPPVPARSGDPAGAGDGLDRLRAMCPPIGPLDPTRRAAVRRDLQVLAGLTDRDGAARSTISVAAEHEQHRRWLARPGASLARRSRR